MSPSHERQHPDTRHYQSRFITLQESLNIRQVSILIHPDIFSDNFKDFSYLDGSVSFISSSTTTILVNLIRPNNFFAIVPESQLEAPVDPKSPEFLHLRDLNLDTEVVSFLQHMSPESVPPPILPTSISQHIIQTNKQREYFPPLIIISTSSTPEHLFQLYDLYRPIHVINRSTWDILTTRPVRLAALLGESILTSVHLSHQENHGSKP